MSGVLDALDPGYTEGFRFGTNRSMVMSREAIRADIAAIGSYCQYWPVMLIACIRIGTLLQQAFSAFRCAKISLIN